MSDKNVELSALFTCDLDCLTEISRELSIE